MSKYDLSILIPARNEMFLAKTVENILQNKRGKTEILVGLDGQWADPGIPDHPDVTIVYYPESLGQRAMTNQLCKLSKAKYVMKIDAHCALDEGFDVKLMEDMQDDWTMIPALYNLHAFNWKCLKCGNTWYQGPTPQQCYSDSDGKVANEKCSSTSFERVIVWQPRKSRRSEFYRFDTNLHFQYHGSRVKHPEAKGDIVETMSAQGSCFLLTRKKYWELDICDEKHGSWGQQGVEIACKTWLSGGRLVTNRRTWYSHMFRTQGGDFGFPYPISGSAQEKARQYSKGLWFENAWKKQVYPLSWLIEKFGPLKNGSKDGVPDWHDEKGKKMLDYVNKKGDEFYKRTNTKSNPTEEYYKRFPYDLQLAMQEQPTKGIIYYTDNQVPIKIGHAARKTIKRAGLPIVSASLKPMDFGKNIHMKLQRGYEAYFRQILAALESSDADIIYFCEHDWLYHPSHFEFTPTDKYTFYYNWNWWRVRSSDGHAVHYDTQMVPGLVAYRELLLKFYRKAVKYLEEVGFTGDNARQVGFEPGTSKRVDLGFYMVEKFESKYSNLDIRHTNNLTSSKWSQDAFRNPKNAQNWIENDDEIPGWGKIYGRFEEFIKSI